MRVSWAKTQVPFLDEMHFRWEAIHIWQRSPTSIIEQAGNEAVAILNHNKPSAYLVPSALYEKMMDVIDDYKLAKVVRERLDYSEDDLMSLETDNR